MTDTRTTVEHLAPYPARSGFLVPWQAEILASWRHAVADGFATSDWRISRLIGPVA